MRTIEHIERRNTAIEDLGITKVEIISKIRELDELLSPYSIFWGESEGEKYIEWGGYNIQKQKGKPYSVRITII